MTEDLRSYACKLRISVVESLVSAGSGHLGGSLGLSDIFAALYFRLLNHRHYEPEWELRDRLILSIGHVAPVMYASLAHSGYFEISELKTLRQLGSRLQGHPARDHLLPGIELSAGSLGQGLSVAVGIALSGKIDEKDYKTICIMGDGELQEGSVWEAAMSAAHHKLNNLIAIVDRNYCQIDGYTQNVMEIEPLAGKWRAFGWEVLECDGNNIEEFVDTYEKAAANKKSPTIIIAKTLMGKGVKAIENDYGWHGKAPDAEQAKIFIREIEESCRN